MATRRRKGGAASPVNAGTLAAPTPKVKPATEYVLVFDDDHEHLGDAIAEATRLLTAEGFVVSVKKNRGITSKKSKAPKKVDSSQPLPPHVLKIVGVDRKRLDREAQFLQLWKKVSKGDGSSDGDTGQRSQGEDNWEPFDVHIGPTFANFDVADKPSDPNFASSFYAPRERAELIGSILEHTRIDAAFAKRFGMEDRLAKLDRHGIALLPELRRMGILESSFPAHDKRIVSSVLSKCLKSFITMPVDDIRAYYGEATAWYYVFMNWFTWWLVPPAVLGTLLYWHRMSAGINIDESPYAPVFALFVVLWAVFGLVHWRRTCAVKSFQWNTMDHEGQAHVRSDFYGTERLSAVTDLPELYYPTWKRRCKYIVSFSVTMFMLGVAFAVMVCSLNLQGYIHSEHSIFHIGALHQFATPGAVFDPNGPFALTLIPVILHTTVIMVLNQFIYRNIATALTNWENHRTEDDYENALILKRFFFEAFDCYIALLYLAFYEQNVVLLRQELMSLYTTDAIRRVLTECIMPLGIQWLNGKLAEDEPTPAEPTTKLRGKWTRPVNFWSVSAQVRRDELEMFDDYLEMIIEFGYVTMFASAFPLASLLSVACNVVELHSDSFKLAYLTRRTPALRASNMGAWEVVLTCQVWLSLLTNTLIFGVGSDQITLWFPWLFKEVHMATGQDDFIIAAGAGRIVVSILWALEHVLLLLAVAIVQSIDSKPKWVRIAIARRQHREHVAKLERIKDTMSPST